MKAHFLLREGITFLNFGSFGACPKPVFEAYQRYQRELEEEPVQFITKKGPALLRKSREQLADYLSCRSNDLIFVPNPTHAVNLVVKSLDLKAGDEILTTNLEYGACDRTWEFYCEKANAHYVKTPITLPLTSSDFFIEELRKGITKNTKMIFVSHITSATALILPVEKISALAREHNLKVFIDGAHVPGHIPLDINALNPDYYTGACHKWMMTPKGSSFLYVKEEWQAELDPLIVSWGYKAEFPSDSQFFDYHQFNGTRDFSAYLTIPDALKFCEDFHWDIKIDWCKELTKKWVVRLAKLLDKEPLAPVTSEFYGQMGSIPINCENPLELKELLYEKYHIEIPIAVHNNQVYIRFSINGFNTEADMEQLEQALIELKQQTKLS